MRRILHLTAAAVLRPGETPDVSFVPPLVRRRLSPLQKIYFALANAVEKSRAGCSVFASGDGEDSLTRRIVADFQEDGSVSPHRFSSSVYNAAPGLWSVHTGNRAPYTAVAAKESSIEAGLLECLGGTPPALFVFAEETGGGYGAAAFFAEDGGRVVEVAEGDPSGSPLSFADYAAFLSGEAEAVAGRWVALRNGRMQ